MKNLLRKPIFLLGLVLILGIFWLVENYFDIIQQTLVFIAPSPSAPTETPIIAIPTQTLPITRTFKKPEIDNGCLIAQESCDCQPPCYWGMTPGLSTEAEVFQMLELKNITAFDYLVGQTRHTIDVAPFPVEFNFSTNPEIVERISVDTNLAIELGQIIDVHGDPDAVNVSAVFDSSDETIEPQWSCRVSIYFDSIQAEIFLPNVISPSGEAIDACPITPETQVGWVIYMEINEYKKWRGFETQAWVGFGSYTLDSIDYNYP